jgi:uncharacterized membrane protein
MYRVLSQRMSSCFLCFLRGLSTVLAGFLPRFASFLVLVGLSGVNFGFGQEETVSDISEVAVNSAMDSDGKKRILDFARDIRPIFEAHCLECHGPRQAKNDFRVDVSDNVLSYVEPSDLDGSSLWTDYLVTEDSEMLMPPPKHDRPLSGAQLAAIKLWIEEGAVWVDPVTDPAFSARVVPRPLGERIAAFAGLFHPAAVHFPIALLLVSAVFSFLAFFRPSAFEGPAFHCLWMGAISAWGASLLGWFYADARGYGGLSFDFASGVDRHRWAAIGASAFSLLLIPIAITARRKVGDRKLHLIWFGGSVLLAGVVSMVGHQGGELVYGEEIYSKAFNAIFESDAPAIIEQTEDSAPSGSSEMTSDRPAAEAGLVDGDVSPSEKVIPALDQAQE